MKTTTVVLLLLATWLSGAAHAQVVFPADSEYRPLFCRNMVMTDGLADTASFLDDKDVVGDVPGPAALRASDTTNLYMRIRLEKDPVQGTALRASSWGMEFDIDNNANTYELLVLVDGIAAPAAVSIFRNTTTTLANDPNDPADAPAAQTHPFAMNGRSVAATGSNFGGTGDFFLDFAVPWSELTPLGLDRDTAVHMWVGSSMSQDSLNGDLACHDGASGAPTLGGTASDPTTGDPNDPGAGGGTGHLEGGGGCSTGRDPVGLLVALAFVLLRRKRTAR
jgi:hypothetical protein